MKSLPNHTVLSLSETRAQSLPSPHLWIAAVGTTHSRKSAISIASRDLGEHLCSIKKGSSWECWHSKNQKNGDSSRCSFLRMRCCQHLCQVGDHVKYSGFQNMESTKRCNTECCCHVSFGKPLLSCSMDGFVNVVLAGSWFHVLVNAISNYLC